MRTLRPLAVGLVVGAVAFACDRSPTGVPIPTVVAARAPKAPSRKSGLVRCVQAYDAVTQLIGRNGGAFPVGPHYVFVDSLALSDTVRITVVAPADTVRWVRLRPDGLVFRTTVDGWSALLYTNYQDCGVPKSDTLRIVQVSDSLRVLGYLQTFLKSKKNPWSAGTQFVVAMQIGRAHV